MNPRGRSPRPGPRGRRQGGPGTRRRAGQPTSPPKHVCRASSAGWFPSVSMFHNSLKIRQNTIRRLKATSSTSYESHSTGNGRTRTCSRQGSSRGTLNGRKGRARQAPRRSTGHGPPPPQGRGSRCWSPALLLSAPRPSRHRVGDTDTPKLGLAKAGLPQAPVPVWSKTE